MKQPVTIPLSRQESATMRLIAHGICRAKHLPRADVDRLAKLGLVQQLDGKVTLTSVGETRLAQSRERQFQSIIGAARDHQPSWRAG